MPTQKSALPAQRLKRVCDPRRLGFKSTATVAAPSGAIGQDRALEALEFGTEIYHFGYNLFVFGADGSGKHGVVTDKIRASAKRWPVPDDWCYVNNFEDSHKPKALRLPCGRARPLARHMEILVEDLKVSLPAAFESEDYRERRRVLEADYQQRHEDALGELQEQAKKVGAALIRTPMGFGVGPVENGEVVGPEVFQKWPEARQTEMRQHITELEAELARIAQDFPIWRRQMFDELRQMNREVCEIAVAYIFEQLEQQYKDLSNIVEWLRKVRQDVIDNAEAFLRSSDADAESNGPRDPAQINGFDRYVVNVMVDNSAIEHAPVIYEDHPTHPNLFGRIEQQARFGALFTDFKLIKPGALHDANGGYLVLDAAKVIAQPFVWEELKRVIRARRLRIEGIHESLGLSSTVMLEPEVIPIDVKVVLIGDRRLHYLMAAYDPDIAELFKVPVDFEDVMDRNLRSEKQYASVIANAARKMNLRPLAAPGVARVIEHASRIAGDAQKLTLQFRHIQDLIREADHYAGKDKSKHIQAAHVDTAIKQNIRRRDRLRSRTYEQMARGIVMIDTAGKTVGQVNGLSVLQLGGFSYGQPSRITARVRMGRGEIIDIERRVELGGALHSKGVMILAGYFGEKFAKERPFALSASLVFEQSYGGVDGDSASSAEIYALLSALSGVPILQNLAVTGSVNQRGEVQAIGGVNQKIEGFFDVCRERSLTGDQGVLIPAANVGHLMLRSDVIEAVEAGQFSVYPVRTIDQGIELLTGVRAGRLRKDGTYHEDTVFGRVVAQLSKFAEAARATTEKRNDTAEQVS